MEKKIVVSGERFFMKFPGFEYFSKKAQEIGVRVVPYRESDEQGFREEVKDASAIIVLDRKISAETIDALEKCQLLMALSVGYDCIDTKAATRKGIPVSNVPTYCTDDVASHTLTLLMTVSRKIHHLIRETRKGVWDYNFIRPVYTFKDKTLGIIGLGKIGRALVPKAKGLGMKTAAYDPYLAEDIFRMMDTQVKYELVELLTDSDYVSIHAPLTAETYHMIDESALGMMKQHAVLINTARGKIVDQDALYKALVGNQIGGAGIDVLDEEPPGQDNKLLSCENAVVTPHVAWYSEESFRRVMVLGMEEVAGVLSGRRPRYVVNPEIFGVRDTP